MKPLKLSSMLILIASALLLSAAGSARSDEKHQNQPSTNERRRHSESSQPTPTFTIIVQPAPVKIIQQAAPEEQQQPAKKWYQRPSATDWGILAVTFAYALISLGLLNATRRQAKISSKTLQMQFRPRIGIRNVAIYPTELMKNEPESERILVGKLPVIGRFCIVNVGGTDATVTEIHAEVTWEYFELPMIRPYDENKPHPLSTAQTLKSGQSITWAFRSAKDMDINVYRITKPEQWKDSTRPPRRLYVLGFIVYADDLGFERRTAFCRYLDSVTQRFTAVKDPDYEHAE
jgi:hypothetical protein